MAEATGDSTTLYAKLERFARTSRPPASEMRKSRVRAAKTYEKFIAGGLLGGSVLMLILIRIIGGQSFMGDILFFGFFCFLIVALVYAASVAGSLYFSKRGSQPKDKWVAAAILEQETRYDDGIPVDTVMVEFEDGRRTSLETTRESADLAKPGRIGWALVEKSRLLRFAAG